MPRHEQFIGDRFWKHVKKTRGCWKWSGATGRYGHLRMRNESGKWSGGLAHRISWELHYGPFPKEFSACHKCDTPTCVRPDHLFLGTHADNIDDKCAKIRQARGERQWKAKLTKDDVLEIRRSEDTQWNIARKFGIHQATVWNILHRYTWKHV